ncbi:DUF455 family protein [Streptomyces sp. CG1]|uniref:DUF455 family protein n=1 Tax=Streptomyces sp. CG1 TaxID=1287523 RepID=UPI0034E1CFF9
MTGINPRLGIPVDETVRGLDELAVALNHCVLLLASWTCDIPEIEAKILVGDHLHRDARTVSALRYRIEELAHDPSPQVDPANTAHCPPDLAVVSWLDATLPRLYGLYFAVKSRLAERMRRHAGATHPVADEPTVRLLREAADDLEAQVRDAGEVMDQLRMIFPDLPAPAVTAAEWDRARAAGASGFRHVRPTEARRDSRFRVLPDAPPVPLRSSESIPAHLHGVLMATEIPTIETCGRAVADFPDMPWEFVLDMGRQSWDESRHARMLYERMTQLGGRPGMEPVDRQVWELTDGLPLELRLAVHQRTGEWLGVDGTILNAGRFRDYGDPLSAQMFDYIAADEITHVRIGNTWVHRLAGSDERVLEIQEAALRHRSGFSTTVNGSPQLPFNHEVCVRAGFKEWEIEALEQRRTGLPTASEF